MQPCLDGEIQITDALTKINEVYIVLFEGKTYNIATRFDWLNYFHRILIFESVWVFFISHFNRLNC